MSGEEIIAARQALENDAQKRVLATKAEIEAILAKYGTQLMITPGWTADGRLSLTVGYTVA